MKEIIQLRHELHKNPELSGNEKSTANRLIQFLSKYKPDELFTNIAGNGIAAVYNGNQSGSKLLFRCDMDALPIQEINDVSYKSSIDGISHLCGHDGHMAMMSGLAVRLHDNPMSKGRVILFYQPEEENGKGAEKSIHELVKLGLAPDFAFAIHNMPKYPFGSIMLGNYIFSAASKGMVVKLTGKSAHAAYPESGLSPALAISEIIQLFSGFKESISFKDFVLLTIVHIRLGEVAFGTCPGDAEIMATLRAFDNEDMKSLTDFAQLTSLSIAEKYKLKIDISFTDDFPASECDKTLTKTVKRIETEQKNKIIILNQPNRWSEDFAHFNAKFPSIIFGLGIGEDHPDLHTNSYDFPDEALKIGVDVMEAIVRDFQK